MKVLIVEKKYNEKKLNTYLLETFSNLSPNTLYKALRKKDIRINNKQIRQNTIIHTGDEIKLFIPDELLFPPCPIRIVYEDNNILVVDKPYGIEVTGKDSLTTQIQNQYNDQVLPCHRLDRNTCGLILYAKNEQSLSILLEKFKKREIIKKYQCYVYGIPKKEQATLEDYLFKDAKKSFVIISKTPKKGYLPIKTSYRILQKDTKQNVSLLEVTLHTGRTHQIRAHLAFIGYPILGDGKYGINEMNKKFGKKHQLLCSYEIQFSFSTDAGILNYLKMKKISLRNFPF